MISKIVPGEGYLILKKNDLDTSTASGFEVEENTDDFLVYAEVKNSGSEEYTSGEGVIFNSIDAQEFRDGADTYILLHTDAVLGKYLL